MKAQQRVTLAERLLPMAGPETEEAWPLTGDHLMDGTSDDWSFRAVRVTR